MAGRNLLPILTIGALGVATAGVGLGYGLAQYTLSGIDPFYATARADHWQSERDVIKSVDHSRAEQQFAAVFAPPPTR